MTVTNNCNLTEDEILFTEWIESLRALNKMLSPNTWEKCNE